MSHSSEVAPGKSASVLNFIGTVTLVIVVFIYISIAIYTEDAIWFWPYFEEKPAQVLVRCYGENVDVDSGSSEMENITALVNEQLSGSKRWNPIGLRDETYQDYVTNQNWLVVEIFYAEPVRVHSYSPFFSGVESLLIPLDGRYASDKRVFGLANGKYTGGSLELVTFEPLKDYLAQSGLCKKP